MDKRARARHVAHVENQGIAAAETVAGSRAEGSPTMFDTDAVLLAEYAALWGAPLRAMTAEAYRGAVLKADQAALCLSGGGVRSAAFALGVIQSLAAKGLLTRFHYLSTVSGGGYIGGWLSRWIADANGRADEVQRQLRESIVGTTGDPPQIKQLRENSNFITPRIGAASTDTWTAIALSARNIVINWLIFGPALLLAVLLFNVYEAAFALVRTPHHAALMLGGAAALLALASYQGCRNLPSYARKERDGGYLFRWVSLPSLAWALIVPLVMSPALVRDTLPLPPGMYLAGAAFVALALGYMLAAITVAARDRASFLVNAPVWLLASAISAAALLVGVRLLERVPVTTAPGSDATWQTIVLGTLGPLWIVIAQLLASNIFVAFRDVPAARSARGDAGATLRPDLDREWLARLSALKIRPALLWTILACTGLLVPTLIAETEWLERARDWISAVVTLVSGTIAILGGRSTGTSSGHETGTAPRKLLSVHLLVTLSTAVFAIFLFAFLALEERQLGEALGARIARALSGGIVARLRGPVTLAPEIVPLVGHLVFAIGLGGLLGATSTRINVNRFSLNGMYRNRLARAFLGSARTARRPDPFTGFDDDDNLPLVQLDARSGTRRVLFPVINVALNIVGGDRLAWQERKAEPFVFTPIACGSAMLDLAPARNARELSEDAAATVPRRARGAFVATCRYAGNERGPLGGVDSGVSLATAMAISGAAASPSMGYHSSPATAFLMTLFNVRLGAWLPNPARAATRAEATDASGPTNALRPLVSELAGLTNDKGDNVYLSDGGHFENLGLYEMIRRRCRFIVVVDAGCDPDCRFEDLGNAIRKIAIDQDRVEISFKSLDIRARTSQASPRFAFALGDIRYPEAPTLPGKLLYIKPSYFEPMPVDIRAYAEVHGSFPHESTLDQWFSESQFESYRRLGEYLTRQLGGEDREYAALADFFRDIDPGAESVGAADAPGEAPAHRSLSRAIAAVVARALGGRARAS